MVCPEKSGLASLVTEIYRKEDFLKNNICRKACTFI